MKRELFNCPGCGGETDGRHLDRELLKDAAVDGFPPPSQAICSQCGQPWNARACGPTHAMVANERMQRK